MAFPSPLRKPASTKVTFPAERIECEGLTQVLIQLNTQRAFGHYNSNADIAGNVDNGLDYNSLTNLCADAPQVAE